MHPGMHLGVHLCVSVLVRSCSRLSSVRSPFFNINQLQSLLVAPACLGSGKTELGLESSSDAFCLHAVSAATWLQPTWQRGPSSPGWQPLP
jgi:hypothetical protein